MHLFTKLNNIREFKAKRDQQYEVNIDMEKILKGVQDTNIKYKMDRLNISENQFITLCRLGRNMLLRQPSLLRLQGPITIATGTVGYYRDLAHIISRCGHPDMNNYLFLGDYVGRGDRNIQCLVLLICLKLKLPNNFFLLRGCQDSIAMTRSFNFYDECIQRFTPKAWTEACQFLCSLPFAAIVQNQIFCCHGGISPSLKSVEDINRITRPLETPEVGLVCDLVWADPSYKDDSLIWSTSERGFSYAFHEKAAEQFLKQNKFSMLCRGHEVIYDGFYINKQKTIGTICSLANYGGIFNNSAAVLILNSLCQVYFKVIKQRQHFPMQSYSQQSIASMLKKVIKQKKIRKKEEDEKIKEMKQRGIMVFDEGQNLTRQEWQMYEQNRMRQRYSDDEEENQHEKYNLTEEQYEKIKILMGKNKATLRKKQDPIEEAVDEESESDQEDKMNKNKQISKKQGQKSIQENFPSLSNRLNRQNNEEEENQASEETNSDQQRL